MKAVRSDAAGTRLGDTDVLAAGAVLWRPGPDGVQVALVHRPRYDDWSLPKGKLDHGESMPAAAVREVAEETGFTARLGSLLGDVRYDVVEGSKLVRYWAAEASTGHFVPNEETDELRWVTPADAAETLSYQRDLDVVHRFAAVGVPTATLLLVRHAKAGSRRQWDGADARRPLSGTGRDQARRLAGFLPLFGPDRVASAPAVRCRETVAPLAQRLAMSVTDEPLLGDDGYSRAPAAGLARLSELAAQRGVTVVCSQGGVIPDVVAELAAGAGRLTGVDPDDVPSRKASTWVLAIRDGELLTADYYPHP